MKEHELGLESLSIDRFEEEDLTKAALKLRKQLQIKGKIQMYKLNEKEEAMDAEETPGQKVVDEQKGILIRRK
jgi:hypothetical protein